MIARDFDAAKRRDFDLVVVGGGIYGVSLLQEAARRGLSACLCEAADFGGGTSWNSLRIVHGGLRYLQTMDLRRFVQSVAARHRMARQFPSLVRPMRCVMPLYGQGMKRVSVLRAALLANDLLDIRRNDGLNEGVRLPRRGLLDADATRCIFPQVRTDGLQGAACWSDYSMISSERIVIELLHDACRHGAVALNYAQVDETAGQGEAVSGVYGRDLATDEIFEIAGRAIVNCTGPRVRDLAPRSGGHSDQLFAPSLAFNLLLDMDLAIDCALAVSTPESGSPTLFLVPQSGGLLAGTMHLPRPAGTTDAKPTEAEVGQLVSLLNRAIPGLGATSTRVRRVFAGLPPAVMSGSSKLQRRERLEDHARTGGPKGLYSACGVKFSTASDVARQILAMLPGAGRPTTEASELPLSPATPVVTRPFLAGSAGSRAIDELLRQLVAQEAVHCAEDLVQRRTNWGVTEPDLHELTASLGHTPGLPAMGRRRL